MNSTLLTALIPPIVTPILAWITARLGFAGRVLRMEYYEKRLTLVTLILTNHRDRFEPDDIVAMENEIKFIADEILASSPRLERDQILGWDRQVWWKRFLTLPPPESMIDWTAATIFYLYLVCGVLYLALLWPGGPLARSINLSGWVVIGAALLSFCISALARSWSMRRAKNRAISHR